ncbi:MAG: NADH-quinone oxidoreductase subunit A [Elusimicrobia bacterium]|nr:NADH-quinone oxidoreductase subunit A [Elusimicrobiota bacterium]
MNAVAFLFNLILVSVLITVLLKAGSWLGPRPAHQGDADMPYETGMPPIEAAVGKMSVLFYRFAVLFVVFDVDLAFLLPWALNRPFFGLGQLLVLTSFVGLLGLMLSYFWRKGVLECR